MSEEKKIIKIFQLFSLKSSMVSMATEDGKGIKDKKITESFFRISDNGFATIKQAEDYIIKNQIQLKFYEEIFIFPCYRIV